jgi:uncharacterized protein YkwD
MVPERPKLKKVPTVKLRAVIPLRLASVAVCSAVALGVNSQPPSSTTEFIQEITRTVNTLRHQGCLGSHALPALAPQAQLHEAAARIHAGLDIKTALADAGYRSVSAQVIHLGGHHSLASIWGVLASHYCREVMSAHATELGIGGSIGNVTILLAQPSIRSLPDLQATVQDVVQLVNAARASGGMCGSVPYPPSTPLVVNAKLEAAAQAHAQDMADRRFYGHRTPEGRSPSDRMQAQGYKSSITAENIAAGQQSAQEAVAGWLKSPGHCRNILMAKLRAIGVGVVVQPSSDRGSYWVQKFGSEL